MSKRLSPKNARTFDQVCSLNRDNTEAGDYWILTDGDCVTLTQQAVGESPVGSVSIPRELFIRFINWYQRPQKIRSKP